MLYNNNKNILYQEFYTKWNYSIQNKKCAKCNNENIDIPIYIIIVYDDTPDTNIYAAVQDNKDRIVIELNKATIESPECNNEDYVKECIMHELFHAREIFALPDKNILLSKKNAIMSHNETNMFLWDNDNKYFKFARFLCNTLADSEIRARLNAVNYKLNNISENILKKYTNRKELINYCFDQVNDVSLYDVILENVQFLNIISENTLFPVEVILYYCHKYNVIKTNISRYNFKYKKPMSKYTYEETEKIFAGLFEIEYKVTKFKR